MNSGEIKRQVLALGAEEVGIASVGRFDSAPEGFRPQDIYPKAKSVIVFLKSLPPEIILCPNPVPYTGTAFLLYSEIDHLGLSLARFLARKEIGAVPVPCDTPYLHWEPNKLRGQGSLSMRHAGYLAGLGYLGKNTLLINPELGNMAYIGAVLVDKVLDEDLISDAQCPTNCRLCIDACPAQAIAGETIDQKKCREVSFFKTPRGFDIYNCSKCRQVCPRRLGYSASD